MTRLEHELETAERKAWDALARYKFQMFGYWAAIWVHLNRIGEFKRANPWHCIVARARELQPRKVNKKVSASVIEGHVESTDAPLC